MKNFAKFLGIIVMVAIIGFSMAACAEEEDEDDKGGYVTFDSALYGNWDKDGATNVVVRFWYVTASDGKRHMDTVTFFVGTTLEYGLDAKNGNTYTAEDLVFTAVVGSDGKLTISGLTDPERNGTYTKRQSAQ